MTPDALIAVQLASPENSADALEKTGTNAAVEQAVRAMLAESPLSKTAYITLAVQDGVLTLNGVVSDGLWLARFKNKVTSAIPSITIEDRLDWVVPECGIGFA